MSIRSVIATAFALSFLAVTAPAKSRGDEKDSPKTPASDVATLAEQVKVLQKQVAELREKTPRIVASGTATFRRPEHMDNRTAVRIKLPADVAAKLGDRYVVMLSTRFPAGGYPYFSLYWKRASDGFDVLLVDTTLGTGSTASYFNRNNTYLIDWMVLHDPSMAARDDGSSDAPARTDVHLTVRVPASAIVWVNGDRSTQTGATRDFTSSGHTPGKTYTYTIRAQWEEDGKVIDRTQKLSVQGGDRRAVDFSKLPDRPTPEPRPN